MYMQQGQGGGYGNGGNGFPNDLAMGAGTGFPDNGMGNYLGGPAHGNPTGFQQAPFMASGYPMGGQSPGTHPGVSMGGGYESMMAPNPNNMPTPNNIDHYGNQMGGQMGGHMVGMNGQMGNHMVGQMGNHQVSNQMAPMGNQMGAPMGAQMGNPMDRQMGGPMNNQGQHGFGSIGHSDGVHPGMNWQTPMPGTMDQFGRSTFGNEESRGKGGKRQKGCGGEDAYNHGALPHMNQYMAPMDGRTSNGQMNSPELYGQNGKGKAQLGQSKGQSQMQQRAANSGYGGNKGGMYDPGTPHSNLFIGNLPVDASEDLLRSAFSPFGVVASCRIFTRNDRTCALVKMGSVADAEQALKNVSRTVGGDPKARWLVKYADTDVGSERKGGKFAGPNPDSAMVFGKGGGAGYGKSVEKGGYGIGQQALARIAKGSNIGQDGGGKGGGSKRQERDVNAAPSDNLYVKGLPPRVTEAQLNRTFSKAGKVVELKILRYGDSLECAALVRMSSIEDAKAAVETLNGTAPEGTTPPLTIRFHGKDPATPSDNLYVKGLPLNFSPDMMHVLFGQFGTIKRSKILLPPGNDITSTIIDSAALVQMSSVEEATMALHMLNGRVPDCAGPQMAIRFAEPSTINEQAPSDNLYVKGLPLGTPDFLLRAVFEQFGTVVRLKVLEPRGGEAQDCAALVQMNGVAEARQAVEALHGRVLAAQDPPMRVRFAGKDQKPGPNLYVAGLPVTIHDQQLRATFAQCGTVVRLRLLVQPGRQETHALVEMASHEEAEKAIKVLHGQPPENLGPTLVVRYASNHQTKGVQNHQAEMPMPAIANSGDALANEPPPFDASSES